jgi:hypothetical protein
VNSLGDFHLGKQVALGSRLHGLLAGKPLVIVGNSSSLNRMDLEKVKDFHTLGCNRILRLFQPDIYTVVDRQPYEQDLALIRAFKGIRLLSCTLFDPAVSCRRMHLQPLPDFPWYRFRGVASGTPMQGSAGRQFVVTSFTNDKRVHYGKLPAVQVNLDHHMATGANIGYCMIQQALALGANPIGIAGIDMEWRDPKDSHFFGAGFKVGAFRFNTARVLRFFLAAAEYAKLHGIQVYNLSPEGVLDCFPRMNEHEFHLRFEKHADREGLRPRQLIEFRPDPDMRLGPIQPYDWRQPHPPTRARQLADAQRRTGAGRGAAPRQSVARRLADIRRSQLRHHPQGRKG